eukprot:TRINITY_DN4517_c0_g6_i1.p1 TRINITY_DN4517_c0_g6~~TRINITY_DN4517_c0_g6_i1.p1  ORF type:complete len:201 (-),score=40.20 TRINITY_DN4517_c0_g6_i1:333-878(-)
MFFLITLQKNLTLLPKFLGPNLKRELSKKLYAEVEGTCSGRYGFIIAVIGLDDIGMGKIQEGTGCVIFKVKYKAIVFRPFRNEVMDAVVTTVNKMGFMAEVGPLQVFVSKHSIPSDLSFDPHSAPACYISEENSYKIAKGDEVRLKITGSRFDATEIFSIGSIKEDYMGLLANADPSNTNT